MKRSTLVLFGVGVYILYRMKNDKFVVGDDATPKKKKKADASASAAPTSTATTSTTAATPAAKTYNLSNAKPWSKVAAMVDIQIPDHDGWIIPRGTRGTYMGSDPSAPYVSFNVPGPWGDGTSLTVGPSDVTPA